MLAPSGTDSPLDVLLGRPAWQRLGACRTEPTVELFPVRDAPTERAKAICDRCGCRNACMAFALSDSSLTLIWGGTSERQRRMLRPGRS